MRDAPARNSFTEELGAERFGLTVHAAVKRARGEDGPTTPRAAQAWTPPG